MDDPRYIPPSIEALLAFLSGRASCEVVYSREHGTAVWRCKEEGIELLLVWESYYKLILEEGGICAIGTDSVPGDKENLTVGRLWVAHPLSDSFMHSLLSEIDDCRNHYHSAFTPFGTVGHS